MARTVQLNYPIKAEIRFDNFVIVMVIIRNILIITGINYWMPLQYNMKQPELEQLEADVVHSKYFQPRDVFAQFM